METTLLANDYPALQYLRTYLKMYPGIFEAYEKLTSTPRNDLITDTMDMLVKNNYEQRGNHYSYYTKALYSAANTICIGDWRKYKTVYSFSNTLSNLLCEMDDFEMIPEVFSYLPYSAFYVESNITDFAGAFVKYLQSKNNKFLFISILSKNCKRTMIIPIMLSEAKMINSQIQELLKGFVPDKDYSIKSTKSFLFYILQVIFYLSSKKPDLEEDIEQKKIYRKRLQIRDKLTEIRKWNVGYRIVIDKKFEKQSKKDSEINSNINRSRKRQHWRKAHWHTYLVGKGRKHKEIKFIAPILVNNIGDELPIVDHNQI